MYHDMLDQVDSGNRYCRKFILWPRQWKKFPKSVNLKWKQMPYIKSNLTKLPNKTGVYAFVLSPGIGNCNDWNYLVYIGKAEEQPLKVRCRQYLSEIKRPKARLPIGGLIKYWKGHVNIYFAAIGNKSKVDKTEKDLLQAFIPPFNDKLPGTLNRVVKEIYRR